MIRGIYRPITSIGAGAGTGASPFLRTAPSHYSWATRSAESTVSSRFTTGSRSTRLGISRTRPKSTIQISTSESTLASSASLAGKSFSQRSTATKIAVKPDWKQVVIFGRAIFAIGSSMAVGDLLCQLLELDVHQVFTEAGHLSRMVEELNIERTMTMFFIGSSVTGPLSQTFNTMLERRIPGTSLRTILPKVLATSTWAFLISMPVLFTATTLLTKDFHGKRGTLKEAKEKIEKDLVSTFFVGVMYWPFINMILFRYVSVEKRAVAISFVATIWNVYLASVVNREKGKKHCQTRNQAALGCETDQS